MIIAAAGTIHIHVTAADWGTILPELIIGAGMLVLLMVDVFVSGRKVELTTGITLATLSLAFLAAVNLWSHGLSTALYQTVTSDRFALFFDYIILISAGLAVCMSSSYIRTLSFDPGEYYALLLAAVAGMMLMAAGINFMVLFIALELFSLALYILSGFERSRPRSQEAGFKYFLLSSFASAFLIYGMALTYGATGSTNLLTISSCLSLAGTCSAAAGNSPLLFVGIALMAVGFAFKISLVPFHMWTPDVYEGAPTPITAFMSVATKAAVFAAFIRVFDLTLSTVQSHWFGILWALAIATMIVGNLLALVQTSMKRLLAYSGIAHAGYVLVAMSAATANGEVAVAFYFIVYAFMNIGAFILVSVLESQGQAGDEIESYRGLFFRNPALAIGTAVFMFSLAGFPPTAGFFAKYLAFAAAVQAGHTDLVIIGTLASLVSVFYYLRVVFIMFTQRAEAAVKEESNIPALADLATWAAVAGSISLGVIPTGALNLASQSVTAVRAIFGLP